MTAAITSGELVLDIGCGCGATSLAAATAVGTTGAVLGADLSEPTLDLARPRADRQDNAEFRQADAQTDPLGGPFDVAISRFGTMFIRALLTEGGLTDTTIEPHTPPLPLGLTAAEAVDYLADSGPGRATLETVSADHHDAAIDAVSAALSPHCDAEHGVMIEAAILVTTARTQP